MYFKEVGQEEIYHGGDILIGGLPLDWGEAFLHIFERGGDVFKRHGLKRGAGIPMIEKINSKHVY